MVVFDVSKRAIGVPAYHATLVLIFVRIHCVVLPWGVLLSLRFSWGWILFLFSGSVNAMAATVMSLSRVKTKESVFNVSCIQFIVIMHL